ncbi:branched-chain amino acid ABC transporter permease/ATP-binding protein [Amycolatopsis pithecellobii]|uniref:ATP-binding cassette domain-containing protein n=1 Tax=Amycolatopsis pithecellobii TaxID=664692 RepID=A0A6N7YZT2_9PSEU|nr:branched-chain amino acid ABC transporter permease/ATP-binding protein [Amycolatopsis pithecellobii]MTD54453.1 ATP-binding cassette domain-containing protein [Amycolatopsis pithecellobii]
MSDEIIRFALLGLATGGIYGLIGLGIVFIYRGSGLLNFAQGAMAMFGAYVYYALTVRFGLPTVVSAVVAILLSAGLGAVIHLFVLRPMRRRNASPLARVIATLSVLLVLQSAAFLGFGSYPLSVPSLLPTTVVHVFSSRLSISVDRLLILGITVALGLALYVVYRRTSFGRVTAAVAENELAASSFGYSPDTIAAVNWAIGSALAGLAGILIAPIILLEPTTLALLVVPGLAAALFGNFSSFPIVLVAALGLGIAQSEISRYVAQPGWSTAAPFLAMIIYMVVRGRALPLRGFVLDRLPKVGTGRVRPVIVALLWGIGAWIALGAGANWDTALVTTCGAAIICLSILLLTGYTGQLSLAQYVVAGIGALAAAKLAATMSLVPAIILACLLAGGIGALVGIPALRSRGATLAVATLGLSSAIVAVAFTNENLTGGLTGIMVPSLSIFGWSVDPTLYPERYALVTFTIMLLIAVAICNLRRGDTGRRLLAVRSNERAAASLGVPVAGMKIYAFFVASVIAALGGILIAFFAPTVQVGSFDVFTCILLVGLTVIGGIGYVPGALFGAALLTGGIFSQIFSGWSSINSYLPLIGAVGLMVTLLTSTDGWFASALSAVAPLRARLDRIKVLRGLSGAGRNIGASESVVVPPKVLSVDGISVAFGGVHAVQRVSIEVRPGEVHGLIGPNGAGKTTLIDAITGFAPVTSGTVRLGDTDITHASARARTLRGLSRSFQSLELFEDLTIEENLAVASQRGGAWRYLTDLVAPGRVRLSDAARVAVRSLHLEHFLGARPTEISFGQRKIVTIARAISGAPSVLLLDEPAAGLDDVEAGELAVLIRRLADTWGIGILLVEHKVDMIMSVSDRVTVLEEGKILASGEPAHIQSRPEVLDAYLGGAPA